MDKYLKNAMRMLGESADKLFEAELPESMLDSYLVTALWSTSPYNPDEVGYENLDDKFSIEDISKEYKEKAKKECDEFLAKAKEIVKKIDPEYVLDESDVGHDFWLTREGHGAGFWDGDYPEEIGEALTKLAKTYKEDSDNLREALPETEEVDESQYKMNIGRKANIKEETKEDIAKDAVAIDEGETKEVYMIDSVDAMVHEDDYEQGQGKNVNNWDMKETKGKQFKTLADLSKIVGYKLDKENTIAFEDGRLSATFSVDEDNSEASKADFEAFKKGDKKLFILALNIYVLKVVPKEPTVKEMASDFSISEG
jgi:hypothetical protein